MKQQGIHFSWKEPQIAREFRSAVSLHSHTVHSRESLAIVAGYAERNTVVGLLVDQIRRRYARTVGGPLDLARAYFTPPLSASGAYLAEADQIRNQLDLMPIVSLTDHDTIAAPRLLRLFLDPETVPISLEWTAPFGPSYYHLGLHNLPADAALQVTDILGESLCARCRTSGASCTASHPLECVKDPLELLELLVSFPNVLIVLNHPLWDVSGVGSSSQRRMANDFLRRCRGYIHAVEVNGLRGWRENLEAMELAEQWRIPVISGGDRHGCEPNAVLNLTQAETFSEFAHEVRNDRRSTVLFMQQYQQPLRIRKLRTAWDVLREHRTQPGVAARWPERVYLPWSDGRLLPLSAGEWSGAPSHKPIEGPQSAEHWLGNP